LYVVVTTFTGSLFGDTCKRFLTGVTMANAQGDTLPGLVFDYSLNATDEGASGTATKRARAGSGCVVAFGRLTDDRARDTTDGANDDSPDRATDGHADSCAAEDAGTGPEGLVA
jgi:hypothetical protein